MARQWTKSVVLRYTVEQPECGTSATTPTWGERNSGSTVDAASPLADGAGVLADGVAGDGLGSGADVCVVGEGETVVAGVAAPCGLEPPSPASASGTPTAVATATTATAIPAARQRTERRRAFT